MFPKKADKSGKMAPPAKPMPAGMPDKDGDGAISDHKGGHGSMKHCGGGMHRDMKPNKKGRGYF